MEVRSPEDWTPKEINSQGDSVLAIAYGVRIMIIIHPARSHNEVKDFTFCCGLTQFRAWRTRLCDKDKLGFLAMILSLSRRFTHHSMSF